MSRKWMYIILFLAFAVPAAGAKIALLIGISEYNPAVNHPGFRQLAGPRNDVESLAGVLRDRWKFDEVQVLTNKVTRDSILSAIDRLMKRVRPGDQVFLYFSGHGTSGLDPHGGFGMDRMTGALVPWDVKRTTSPVELLKSLVIASRDLRPRLQQIDRTAEVFAAFDACYSGNSIKSLPAGTGVRRDGDIVPPGVNRSGFIAELNRHRAELSQAAPRTPYPYRHLIYMSASSASEPAYDIDEAALKMGRRTFDGQPHGAFSSALIDGLRSSATGHDGALTYSRLHQFVVRALESQVGQLPQLVYNTSVAGLSLNAVFGGPAPAAPATQAAPPAPDGVPLRIRISAREPGLRKALSGADNLRICNSESDPWDALAERGNSGDYILRHPSGAEIFRSAPSRFTEFTAVIRDLAVAQKLSGLTYGTPDFIVGLDLLPNEPPLDREVFYRGETMKFRIRSEKSAHLLLLNIDQKGWTTILYPSGEQGGGMPTASLETGLMEVREPFGLETLKIFAFPEKPKGYDTVLSYNAIRPGSKEFESLRTMLREVSGPKAEFKRILVSTSATKPSNN